MLVSKMAFSVERCSIESERKGILLGISTTNTHFSSYLLVFGLCVCVCVYGLNIMIIHTHKHYFVFKCPLGIYVFALLIQIFFLKVSLALLNIHLYIYIYIFFNVIVVVGGGLFLGVRPALCCFSRGATHISRFDSPLL